MNLMDNFDNVANMSHNNMQNNMQNNRGLDINSLMMQDNSYEKRPQKNSRNFENSRNFINNNSNEFNEFNQLKNKINDMKIHIAENMGLDAQSLLNMSPEQIESQIKNQLMADTKKSSSKNKYVKNESESESEFASEDETDKKEKLLKMIYQMKKNNLNKEKGLSKAVKEAKSKSKSTSKSKSKSKKVESSEESDNHSDDESNSDSGSETNSRNKNKKTNIKTKQNNNKGNKNVKFADERDIQKIIIQPDEKEDSKYYSDFMIDFNEKYNRTFKNISNLQLKVKKLPKLTPLITSDCNTLNIIINGETKNIELDDGEYSIDDIVDGITENLSDVNIECKIDKNNRVIIQNTEGEDFDIDCTTNSFAKYLGFVNDSYSGESKYISELPNKLSINKIYLFIPNIQKELFCTINEDSDIDLNIDSDLKISELDSLIIQIKNVNTQTESNFHDFYGNKFCFELTFECDKE
jgi:hypothetical protein